MAASLLSLDSSVLRKIANCLPEVDQSSLRRVSQDCRKKLEVEAQWAEKCRSMYPTIAKAPDITWRDHYISCYVRNLPHNVAFMRGRQWGSSQAPIIMSFIGTLSYPVLGTCLIIYCLFPVLNLIVFFGFKYSISFPIIIILVGVTVDISQKIFLNQGFSLLMYVSSWVGQTAAIRNIFGTAAGYLNSFQYRLFRR